MKNLWLLIFLIFSLSACSHVPANSTGRALATPSNIQTNQCEISPEDREALLRLEYWSFD